MAPARFVLHGHFYQPPRENPWTEVVGVEPSAAPAHDWNERIQRERYRPNAHARIVDDHGMVVAVVSNYDHLSFNIGPTLAAWMHEHHPGLLAEIVASDGRTGRAIAQGYSHMILPLASERDIRTQVRWGLADFAHRFGRPARGIWLPETAVDDATLAVLAEEGVGFTILAPYQVVRTRPLAGGEWQDVGGGIDTSRPHRWRHPTRPELGVDLVLYDGPLSHAMAFGLAGESSQALVERVISSAGPGGLVTAAADGETFGHHHPFTERSLAYAFAVEAPRRGLVTTSPAEELAAVRPTTEVQVVPSAWSCAHGVGRWKEDCGCSTGGPPGSDQAWRAPLRQALDLLRDHAATVFETAGAQVLHDPWAARDDYVQVVLGAWSVEAFTARHVRAGEGPAGLSRALTLLESQRHAMLMYTSCGWFFHDLAGLETVQILRYAARCLDLLEEAGDRPPLDAFLAVLARARSNDPAEGTGADIWHRQVLAARVDDRRVVAHLGLMDLLEGTPPAPVLAGRQVAVDLHHHAERGPVAFSCGRVALVHHRTLRRTTHLYAAFHLGGLEVLGLVRPEGPDAGADAARLEDLAGAFREGVRLTEVLRRAADVLGSDEFGLEDALPDAAEQVLATAADRLADAVAQACERLFVDQQATFDALTAAGYSLPAELRAPAELVLSRRLEAELVSLQLAWSDLAAREARDIAADARRGGLRIDGPAVSAQLEATLEAATRRVLAGTGGATEVSQVVALARRLGADIDLSVPQELVYEALARTADPAARATLAEAGRTLGLAVEVSAPPR